MVLLKNEKNTLPLSAGSIKSLALLGPHGQATSVMQGNYNGIAPFVNTTSYHSSALSKAPALIQFSPVNLLWLVCLSAAGT